MATSVPIVFPRVTVGGVLIDLLVIPVDKFCGTVPTTYCRVPNREVVGSGEIGMMGMGKVGGVDSTGAVGSTMGVPEGRVRPGIVVGIVVVTVRLSSGKAIPDDESTFVPFASQSVATSPSSFQTLSVVQEIKSGPLSWFGPEVMTTDPPGLNVKPDGSMRVCSSPLSVIFQPVRSTTLVSVFVMIKISA